MTIKKEAKLPSLVIVYLATQKLKESIGKF